jgi:hypothetical protein
LEKKGDRRWRAEGVMWALGVFQDEPVAELSDRKLEFGRVPQIVVLHAALLKRVL